MHLTDAQAQSLKLWLNDKVSHDSDADSDILADYVLALVRGEGSIAELRASCVENLKDFLQDGTERFVDEVLYAVQEGTYLSSAHPLPTNASQPTRKRSRDPHTDNWTTRDASKHRRKYARKDGRGRYAEPHSYHNSSILPNGMTMHDALSAMAAMQQVMGLPPLQGMDQMLSQAGPALTHGQPQRCYDHAAHASSPHGSCNPFNHLESHMHSPGKQTSGGVATTSVDGNLARVSDPRDTSVPPRHERRQRSALSDARPNRDKTITTIVVEQIPRANFTDRDIRAFFSQFGAINSLVLHEEQEIAVITYSTWTEANAAYQSSKPIFDNRFVKVFWRRSNRPPMTGEQAPACEASFDWKVFSKQQAQAQERYDARQKVRDEAVARKAVIDARLRDMEAERHDLSKRFATKTDLSASDSKPATASIETESDLIIGLRAQLAKLEAEAQTLGLKADDTGVGTFASAKASGYPSHFDTRGVPTSMTWSSRRRRPVRGSAVRRLDNRTRSVVMVFGNSTYEQSEEALKRYLLLSGQLEEVSISPRPGQDNAAILVFKERYQAEIFIAAVSSDHTVPEVGIVEVAWLPARTVESPAPRSSLTSSVSQGQSTSDADKVSSIGSRAAVMSPIEAANGFDIDEGTQWD